MQPTIAIGTPGVYTGSRHHQSNQRFGGSEQPPGRHIPGKPVTLITCIASRPVALRAVLEREYVIFQPLLNAWSRSQPLAVDSEPTEGAELP
jgi:hypothetical protein